MKSSVRDIEGLSIRKIELNWMSKSQKTNWALLTKMIGTKKILRIAKGSSETEKVQVYGMIHSFNYTEKWFFFPTSSDLTHRNLMCRPVVNCKHLHVLWAIIRVWYFWWYCYFSYQLYWNRLGCCSLLVVWTEVYLSANLWILDKKFGNGWYEGMLFLGKVVASVTFLIFFGLIFLFTNFYSFRI